MYGTIEQFYNYTIKEIELIIIAHRKHRKNELLEMASLNYSLATHIIQGVGVILGGGSVPTFDDLYNHLLNEEDMEDIEQAKADKEAEKMKAQMVLFMNNFNSKRKEDDN